MEDSIQFVSDSYVVIGEYSFSCQKTKLDMIHEGMTYYMEIVTVYIADKFFQLTADEPITKK